VYPSPDIWVAIGAVLDADAENATVRAYNDWLAEFVSASPERLVGVAQIPSRGGIDVAIDELRRAKELGLRGCILRSFPTGELTPNADDDKFYSQVVELGAVLSFDTSFGFSPEGTSFFGPNAVQPIRQFVYNGVVERFPTMRVVVSVPTAGWLPYWLEGGDDRYLRYPAAQNKDLTRPLPSEYVRRQPFFTFSGEDPLLAYSDDYVSFSHLMWSSQYPTFYGLEAAKSIERLAGLDSSDRDQIFSKTCRSLYGLPGGGDIDFDPPLRPLQHAVPA
jgi:predicted TIM-barrel fold metal-dependent hydrolase